MSTKSMISFEDWWVKVTDDDLWWDRVKMKFPRKNHKAVGEDCYTRLLTQPERLHKEDVGDWRRAFWNACIWIKDEMVRPQLQQEEVKSQGPIDPKNMPLTGEARDKKLQEWKQKILNEPIAKPMPKLTKKEIADEGDWLPKKPAPYIPTIKTERESLILEAIATVRAEFYGDQPIDRFGLRTVGKYEVFAKSEDDALIIIIDAEKRVDDYMKSPAYEEDKKKRI